MRDYRRTVRLVNFRTSAGTINQGRAGADPQLFYPAQQSIFVLSSKRTPFPRKTHLQKRCIHEAHCQFSE
jgi:hypothetical protein